MSERTYPFTVGPAPLAPAPPAIAERRADPGVPTGETEIVTECIDGEAFGRLCSEWDDLCRRAAFANVFMDPALAASLSRYRPVRVFLAWRGAASPGRGRVLLGAWVVVRRRERMCWPFPAVASPTIAFANLGTPVVDRALRAPVLAALLASLRAQGERPRFAVVGDINAALLADLEAAMAGLGMAAGIVERRQRSRLLPHPDPEAFRKATTTKSHRSKKRRKRIRLREEGRLDFTTADGSAAVQGFEEFLALEAGGWKGARGSALALAPEARETARAMVAKLALRSLAVVHALRLDGKPVAASVLLRSGPEAFMWRTAYDEAYHACSPGALLLDDVTAAILRDPSIVATDSCCHRDEGPVSGWPERHEVTDLLIALRPDPIGAWRLLVARERALRWMREEARRRVLDAQARYRAMRKSRAAVADPAKADD